MYIQKKLPIELKRYIHSYIPYQSCILCNKKFVFYSEKKIPNYAFCSIFCYSNHTVYTLTRLCKYVLVKHAPITTFMVFSHILCILTIFFVTLVWLPVYTGTIIWVFLFY